MTLNDQKSVGTMSLRTAFMQQSTVERTILSTPSANISLAETVDWFDRVRQAVGEVGVETGDRVAVITPQCVSSAILLLSLFEEYTLLPLNPNAQVGQLEEMLRTSQADFLIAPPSFIEALPDAEPSTFATVSVLGDHFALCRLRYERAPTNSLLREPGIVLHTSGTTGSPKRVPLKASQLFASASNIGQHLELSSEDCAIHCLPMFHVGAFVDLLLAPLIAGGKVAFASDPSPNSIVQATLKQRGTWLQLVPTMLTHLLSETDPQSLLVLGERVRFIRMVSADLTETLLRKAETSLNGVPVIQMYGMTETSGQIASNHLSDTSRPANSVGRLAGPEVCLIDSQGAVVEIGREGEICVSGATVMERYEGDDPTPMHGRWFRTGDAGRFDEDGYLYLTGRLKEMINRGGEKISPVVIERAAKEHSGIGEAAAFALPHSTLGEQVGLVVTQAGPEVLSENALLDHLRSRIAEHEMPRSIHFVEAMPRLPSGKLDRRLLVRRATDTPLIAEETSRTGQVISELWQKVLCVRAPYDDADFFDDGGDSLTATEFIHQIENKLRIPLPPNILFDAPRFRQLVDAVEAIDASEGEKEPQFMEFIRRETAGWQGQRVGPRRLLVARNTFSTKTPFVFGVNGIHIADAFCTSVLDDHPIYLMRSLHALKGRSAVDQKDLADVYAEEIHAVTNGSPVIFGGYCAGAELAARVASRICSRGQHVPLLISIDQGFYRQTPFGVLYIASDTGMPFGKYYEPEAAFGYWHPEGSASIRIPGGHTAGMTEENFQRIAEPVREYLDGKPLVRQEMRAPSDSAERQALYSAQIKTRVPRFWRHNTSVRADVTVRNTSGMIWQKGAVSGLRLVAQFMNFDLHTRKWKAATAAVPHDVLPGESFSATLDLTYPDTNLPLILRLSMVDDGYCYFEQHGSATFNRVICVWPTSKASRAN